MDEQYQILKSILGKDVGQIIHNYVFEMYLDEWKLRICRLNSEYNETIQIWTTNKNFDNLVCPSAYHPENMHKIYHHFYNVFSCV